MYCQAFTLALLSKLTLLLLLILLLLRHYYYYYGTGPFQLLARRVFIRYLSSKLYLIGFCKRFLMPYQTFSFSTSKNVFWPFLVTLASILQFEDRCRLPCLHPIARVCTAMHAGVACHSYCVWRSLYMFLRTLTYCCLYDQINSICIARH